MKSQEVKSSNLPQCTTSSKTSRLTKLKNFIRDERIKLIKTLAMYISFIGLGLGLGVCGPSMLDLQISTQASLNEITWMIIGRALGIGFGSLANIVLHRITNVYVLIAASMTIGGILEGYVPFSPNVWILIGIFFGNGLCMGIVETCSNSLLAQIWGKRCPSFLQALYFCFGLGCILSPLLVRPFLLPLTEDMMIAGDTDFTPQDVKVHFAYLVISIFMILSGGCWWYVYFKYCSNFLKQGSRSESIPQSSAVEHFPPTFEEPVKNQVILYCAYVAAMLFMFFYCGVEIAVGSYLTPFAVKSDMHLSKATGALMSSTYWMTFTFARLATIFYIDWMGPKNNLIMALGIVGLSNVIMVPFGNSIEGALWAGISLNGIGMSSIWATLVAFIAIFTPVTESLTSLMVASACFGECVIPIVISALIEWDVRIFLWTTLFSSASLIVLFCLLYLLLSIYASMKAGQTAV